MEKKEQKQEAYLTGTHSVLKGVLTFPSEIETWEKNHSKSTQTERWSFSFYRCGGNTQEESWLYNTYINLKRSGTAIQAVVSKRYFRGRAGYLLKHKLWETLMCLRCDWIC